MMQKEVTKTREGERGSALVYILIAIALLAALTVAFMNPSSNQTSSQNMFKTVSEIQSQVDFIRAAVQECVLLYPGGDINITNTAAGDAPGANKLYPISPDSDYLTDPETAPNRLVSNLRCPGNPGDDPDHADIFGGNSGKFLPPPPNLFGPWQWYNGPDGIFFWTETTATDAFIDTVMTKLNESYGVCEADTIDATGGAENLTDGNPVLTCPNGATCFRVWIIADRTRGGGNVEDGTLDNDAAHFPTPDVATPGSTPEQGANCDPDI